MTPTEFKAIRNGAGYSQNALADLLRISDGRTVRRWEDGSRPVTGPISILMEGLRDGWFHDGRVRKHRAEKQ